MIVLIILTSYIVGFGKAPLPSNAYKSYDRLTKKMYLRVNNGETTLL